VAPDGTGDFPTIQAAVDAATDGDEILLESGLFCGPGNVDVDFLGKAITIRGTSGHPADCVIRCYSEELCVFRFTSGEGPSSVLEDLTIDRFGPDSGAVWVRFSAPTLRNVRLTRGRRTAIRVEGGAPLLTGCVLESNAGPATATRGTVLLIESEATLDGCAFRDNRGPACILARGGTTTIRACALTGNATLGIAVVPGVDGTAPVATVEGCTITDNGGGIVFAGDGGSSVFTLRDCEIRGNQGAAIRVGGPTSLSIEGCRIVANDVGIDVVAMGSSGPRVLVRDCDISGQPGGGLRGGGSLAIERCTIRGNGESGLLLSGCRSAVIRDCLVTGNAGHGVRIRDCTSVSVQGCTVTRNVAELPGGGLHVVDADVDVMRAIVWGNCGPGPSDVWQSGSTVGMTCVVVDTTRINSVSGGTFVLKHVVDADPLFCDPLGCALSPSTQGVYSVNARSPALTGPCGSIGAPASACDALLEMSWGAMKALYR